MRSKRGFTPTPERGVASHGRKASPPRLVSGFTLVEILIYIAIFAVVAGMLSTVLITVIRIQSRDAASNEVATQLDFVLTTVQRLVRDSSLIDLVYEGTSTSTACSTYCTMRLRMEDSIRDPVIVRSDANGIYLREGSGEEVALTTDKVIIDSFELAKFETLGGHATMRIDASFTFNSSKPELAITKTLQSAISRASAAVFDSDLIPNADNTWSIGQATMSWRDLILSNDLTVGGDASVANDLTILGDVGVGMTNPNYQLELSQNSAAKPGTNTWTITSDERVKKDIRPFNDGLDVIMGINPVWYKYNGKGEFEADGNDYIGVIAQDIQKVAPYTVGTYMAKLNPDDETETELLDFESHALIFNLINAVKELNAKVDSLAGTVENAVVKVKELVADSIKARVVRVEYVEYVDRATGEIYCVWIENGDFVKEKGDCE